MASTSLRKRVSGSSWLLGIIFVAYTPAKGCSSASSSRLDERMASGVFTCTLRARKSPSSSTGSSAC